MPGRSTVFPRSTVAPGPAVAPESEQTEEVTLRAETGDAEQVRKKEGGSTTLLVISILMLVVLCVLYGFVLYRERVKREEKLATMTAARNRVNVQVTMEPTRVG
jgi:heme/copper-type cytochrome/quinol oxidase subunit 2